MALLPADRLLNLGLGGDARNLRLQLFPPKSLQCGIKSPLPIARLNIERRTRRTRRTRHH
jgi:hypothetical protein